MTSELSKKIQAGTISGGVLSFFVEINGEFQNSIKLTKSRMMIGSSETSDIRVEHEDVSNIHAILEIEENGAINVYDMASEKGLKVNGKAAVSETIKIGDTVEIGAVKLVLKKMSLPPKLPSFVKADPAPESLPDVDDIIPDEPLIDVKEEIKAEPVKAKPAEELKQVKAEPPKVEAPKKIDEPKKVEEVKVEAAKKPQATLTPKAAAAVEARKAAHVEINKEAKPRGLEYVTEEETKPLILEDPRNIENIFDYKRTSLTALQVVMYYHDTMLDVGHYIKQEKITFGENGKCDFLVPNIFGNDSFAVISGKNGEYVLNLHPKMRGVIKRENKVIDIKEFANQGSVKLQSKDVVKLVVGSLSFFISFTPAPPTLINRRVLEKDALFFKTFIISMILSVATMIGLNKISVSDKISIEQLPDRVATMIYEPIKPKTEPKPIPKPIVKESAKPVEPSPTAKVGEKNQKKADVGKEVKVAQKLPENKKAGGQGEGEKHKGDAGKMGEATAKAKGQAQLKAETPGTGEKQPTDRQNLGKSQAPGQGVIDALKSSDISGKISQALASGSQGLSGAGKKLQGYGSATTQGTGGFALEGAGQGGGGKAETYGLGNKGVGAGYQGKGLGQMGEGGGIIGGRGKVTVDTSGGAEETVVMGSVDKDIIRRLIQERGDQIRYCYEKELNTTPNISGKVAVRFVIGPIGAVTQSGVVSNSTSSSAIGECVVNVVKSIRFPAPKGGGIAEATYPFMFKPSHK